MPPKKYNPITEKLLKLINSGKMTKEKICVAADLKYPTLENAFLRATVSYSTLRSLKFAGIISDRDEANYREWALQNSKRRKGGKNVNAETSDYDDKHEKSDGEFEGIDESEIFNPDRAG